MQNSQIFTLIEGEFSPIESRDLLYSIFKSKIKFHRMKNFSSQERFGVEDENALEKIKHLKNRLSELEIVIKTAENNGDFLQIESKITVVLKPQSNLLKEK